MSGNSRVLKGNLILGSLTPNTFKKMKGDLEPVTYARKAPIFFRDSLARQIYFPNTGCISGIRHTADGQAVEIHIVGNEGVVGVDAMLGSDVTDCDFIAETSAEGFRMKTAVARQAFEKYPDFRGAMLRYFRFYIQQVSQNVVCSRLHSAEARLARCLLKRVRVTGITSIELTQENLCLLLGLTRPSVCAAVSSLERVGAIKAARGQIVVLDFLNLSAHACECFEIVGSQYENYIAAALVPTTFRPKASSVTAIVS